MTNPFVSVVIPVKAISDYLLTENLPSLSNQTYRNFETIVLPNKSPVNNKNLVSKYPWLRIIPTRKISRPAQKRDMGVKESRGEIIAFIDDDAYPAPDWLEKAIKIFKSSDKNNRLAVVCGPGLLPLSTNNWEKSFDEILKSPVGSGEYKYRFIRDKSRYVDDYPSMNFLIKKNLFDKVGGFNNEFWPGEDSKLCNDLVYKEKKLILYHPDIVVYHHRRNNLKDFLKQHSNYGFHRGAFFAHGDRNSQRLSYLVPSFFVFYLIFLFFTLLISNTNLLSSIFYILLSFPLFSYLVFAIYLSVISYGHKKNFPVSLLVPFILFLTHFTYGIMFVRGLFTGLLKKERIYD